MDSCSSISSCFWTRWSPKISSFSLFSWSWWVTLIVSWVSCSYNSCSCSGYCAKTVSISAILFSLSSISCFYQVWPVCSYKIAFSSSFTSSVAYFLLSLVSYIYKFRLFCSSVKVYNSVRSFFCCSRPSASAIIMLVRWFALVDVSKFAAKMLMSCFMREISFETISNLR